MIKKLRFENFYSFGGDGELSFEIGKKPSPSYYDINLEDGSRINKVTAIIGANGSGKTQLLRPLAFLSWFIAHSYPSSKPNELIPFQPHMLKRDMPTHFEIEFILGGRQYKYNLSATTDKVVHESLHTKTSHLYSYIFARDLNGETYKYKQKEFDFKKSLADKIRGNVSLISAAFMHDSSVATELFEYFERCTYNVSVMGRKNFEEEDLVESAEFFYENQDLHNKVNELICELDLGLSSVEIRKINSKTKKGEENEYHLPLGVHKSKEGEFRLPFWEESNGTKSTYVILRTILPVLEHGGLAIIDELDNDLHLHMLLKIIELFKSDHTNPKQAQLVFSSHSHEILNVLRKHQLYLVEKVDLNSEAWRLDKMVGLRADDNLYAKYQAGALGAVPNL